MEYAPLADIVLWRLLNSSDWENLFDEFSYYDTYINEAKTPAKIQQPEYNTAAALYDFKY